MIRNQIKQWERGEEEEEEEEGLGAAAQGERGGEWGRAIDREAPARPFVEPLVKHENEAEWS